MINKKGKVRLTKEEKNVKFSCIIANEKKLLPLTFFFYYYLINLLGGTKTV